MIVHMHVLHLYLYLFLHELICTCFHKHFLSIWHLSPSYAIVFTWHLFLYLLIFPHACGPEYLASWVSRCRINSIRRDTNARCTNYQAQLGTSRFTVISLESRPGWNLNVSFEEKGELYSLLHEKTRQIR